MLINHFVILTEGSWALTRLAPRTSRQWQRVRSWSWRSSVVKRASCKHYSQIRR